MDSIQSKKLPVPGASVSYTMRGSGPLLLLIAGGEGGGDGYNNLANAMSDRYTVVTYDRRGALGSPVENPEAEVYLETHSEDAHHLLACLTNEPAFVFGSSAGALVGLDLVIRYPDQVRALVSHEPPVEGLLPEFDRFQAEMAQAQWQGNGPAAIIQFMTHLGVRYDDLEAGVVLQPRDPQETILRGRALKRYTFPAVHRYRLDVSALAAAPVPVILAAGSADQATPLYLCAQTLAGRLGSELVEFPSHHAGYVSYPRAFAERLDEVLKETFRKW